MMQIRKKMYKEFIETYNNFSEGNLDDDFNVTSVSGLLLLFLIFWPQAMEARLILLWKYFAVSSI